MNTKTVRVRVLDAEAVRQGFRDGNFIQIRKGTEFDAHPVEAKILLESGAVEVVAGADDVRGVTSPRPYRSGREFAASV